MGYGDISEEGADVTGVAEVYRKDLNASLLDILGSFYFFINNYNSYF